MHINCAHHSFCTQARTIITQNVRDTRANNMNYVFFLKARLFVIAMAKWAG